MNGFLDQVAADLLRRYGDGESGDSDNGSGDPSRKGNDGGGSSNPSGKGGKGGELSSLHIMLPSRRAGLFFGEALSALIERPIWQPTAITIDTLAEELSGGLAVGDRLRLVVELYKIYAEFHPTETFDGFWFWGELLLGDFDSIDKYLVDADTLFSNLVDLHELDSRFDYLTDGQRAVIEKFWSTFGRTGATDRSGEAGRFGEADRSGTTGDRAAENGDDGNGYGATDRSRATDTESAGSSGGERIFSPEQTDFLRVWRTLAPIYHRFRARLRELGIAYAGMVYREAAERIARGEAPQIPRRHYVIAGFNALSACERAIFEHLQKNFEVDFYWDHDLYYTGDGSLARAQEAGRFMRDNLRRFPPVAPLSGGFDNFSKPKRIRSVSAGSDVLQCKYAGMRLAEMARPNGGSGAGSVGGTADGSVESGAGGAGGAGDGSVESGAGSVSGAGDGSVESGAGGAGGAGDGSDESAKKIGRETAIVLADEGLLTPLLWSVPPEVDAVNITMGYPLRMHPAYTFVERLLELQNRRRTSRNSTAFHHSDVEGLLRHPFLGASCSGAAGGSGGTGGAGGAGGAGTTGISGVSGVSGVSGAARLPRNSQYVYVSAARLRTTPLLEKVFSAPAEGWRAASDYLVDIVSEVARAVSNSPGVAKNTGNVAGNTANATENALKNATENIGNVTENKTGNNIDIAVFALVVDHIRTLTGSLEACGVDPSPKTWASLLRRSLQSVTIPFEGEPLEGVQIMGILETRALDFDNVIFLSSGDSTMPGNLLGAPSFIPYNLKMAYGLPTPEHHEGVWAYHFFRLIQRARNVEMVWSSTTDDRSTGEPSRYIVQLDYESPHVVEKGTVTIDVSLSPVEAVTVEKSPTVMASLREFLRDGGLETSGGAETSGGSRTLSPSMFFSYVECPLKFYFRAVARLRADDEISDDVDNALFGNMLHLAMQRLYTPLKGVRDPRATIRKLIGSPDVEAAVTEAVTALYTREENARPEDWGGSIVLAHKTIVDYINRNVLPFDASRPEAFTILELEAELSMRFEGVGFRGIADRIDRLGDGTLRVVDYKTGGPKTKNRDNERFTSIESLFVGSADERISAVLQTLLYAMMLRERGSNGERGGEWGGGGVQTQKPKIQPALYYIRNLSKDGYSPLIFDAGGAGGGGTSGGTGGGSGEGTGGGMSGGMSTGGAGGGGGAAGSKSGGGGSRSGGREVDDYADYAPEFEAQLKVALHELFDPAISFVQCADPAPCAWCDFNALCRR